MDQLDRVAVLGLAAYPRGCLWPEIEMLVRSIYRNAPQMRVVLVTGELSADDARTLSRFGATALPLLGEIPRFKLEDEASRAERAAWILELYGRRYALYSEAMATISESRVLLSDVRDVIVTRDLPVSLGREGLVLSQERADVTLESETWNRRWLLGAYGPEGLQKVGKRSILCAGCTLGPRDRMGRYVAAMQAEITRVGVAITRQVGDQPLHNYLAHSGALGPFETSAAEDGPVRTIGLIGPDSLKLDWLTKGPQQPSVLHQYDRHMHRRRIRWLALKASGLLTTYAVRAVIRRIRPIVRR